MVKLRVIFGNLRLKLYIISISDQTAGAGRLGAGRGGDGGVHLLFFGQVPALPQLHHGRHHFTEMFRTEIMNMKTFDTRNVACKLRLH